MTGLLGLGLLVEDGATASVLRGLIRGNHDCGVSVEGASTLSLEDVSIRDTASLAYDGRFGRGLHVEGGGDITVTHSELVGNRDVSLAVFDEDTNVALRDVRIRDSRERECVELPEGDPNRCTAGRGYGLGAYDGATITVDDVVISDSASLGVQLADGGTIAGSGLRIRGCPVAVNLQSLPDEYDWEGAVTDLIVDGCEVELDETETSVPEHLPE